MDTCEEANKIENVPATDNARYAQTDIWFTDSSPLQSAGHESKVFTVVQWILNKYFEEEGIEL